MDARQAPRAPSFGAEWHNLIRFGIGPAECIDADGFEILGENLRIGGAPERSDHQPSTVRRLRNIAVDTDHQVTIAALDALELLRQRAGVGTACQLQPNL